MDGLAKYKGLYIETAREYLQEMREKVALLSRGEKKEELVKAIHRAAHSLSGQSSVAGYGHIAGVASVIERIFKAQLDDQVSDLEDEVLSNISSAIEKMLLSVQAIEADEEEMDLSGEIEALEA